MTVPERDVAACAYRLLLTPASEKRLLHDGHAKEERSPPHRRVGRHARNPLCFAVWK